MAYENHESNPANYYEMQEIGQVNIQEFAEKTLRVAAESGSHEVVKYLSSSTHCSRQAVRSAAYIFCKLPEILTTIKLDLISYLNQINKLDGDSFGLARQIINGATKKKNADKASYSQITNPYSYRNGSLHFNSANNKSEMLIDSCFSPRQMKDIEKRIAELNSGLKNKSYWSFFYDEKARKKHKIEGLEELIRISYKKATIASAIKEIDKKYKDLRAGWFSETDALLDELLDAEAPEGCFCW